MANPPRLAPEVLLTCRLNDYDYDYDANIWEVVLVGQVIYQAYTAPSKRLGQR